MQTVFIPNRGEVVRRVARTARRMGLRVAVGYSDADAPDPFLRDVDVALRLGPAAALESYLSLPRVMEAAVECHADLIHPGYGFLAEDPGLAAASEQAGIRFVGPTSQVLQRVSSKSACRALAESLGIPVVQGFSDSRPSDDVLVAAAERLGYPVVVKPAAGGGGKGIVVVHRRAELPGVLTGSRRIARAAFGNDELLIERYVSGARHVEVQVLRDHFGNVVVLGDRDCSTQRRHQKVIEECPAHGIDPALRQEMHSSAKAIVSTIGYVNAGTIEFIVEPDGRYYFMELNPRLQVEHPVTELVWGVDLVEQQLLIALGEPAASPAVPLGSAIEARVCAEDPAEGFLPSSGRIEHLRWPSNARVDAALEEGSEVTPFYDSLLGKVVAYGPDRSAALNELATALRDTCVLGVITNLPLLRALVSHPRLREGTATTDFLEDTLPQILPLARPPAQAIAVAGVFAASSRHAPEGVVYLRDRTHAHLIRTHEEQPHGVGPLKASSTKERHEWLVDGVVAAVVVTEGCVWVELDGQTYRFETTDAGVKSALPSTGMESSSPMTGRVASVAAKLGETVKAGQVLLSLEAMKMEMPVVARRDGRLKAICAEGDNVIQGQILFQLEDEVPAGRGASLADESRSQSDP
jgi:acetyl-CoA/propionyl-CoA carboxylase biotin carboxyl carrier protein